MTPIKADEVPADLRAILDQAAGKEHSATGPVMTCLAEILTNHKRQVRAQVADEIEAEYRRRESDGLAIGPLLHAADIARNGATDVPRGTGDAHTPEHGHGEGSGDSKASQGRSEAQEGE